MSQSRPLHLMIPVSLGELADKITILAIKRACIKDAAGLKEYRARICILAGLVEQGGAG